MRPRKYPYSGTKESTFVKADPELVEKLLRPQSISTNFESLTTRLEVTTLVLAISFALMIIDKGDG